MRLSFPPDALQVVTPSAGQSIVGIWTSPPRFDNQKGEIILQGGIPQGINVSKGLVSTITFRVRKTGNVTLRFQSDSRVLLHDGLGTDDLNHAQNGVYQFVLPPPAGPGVASETHPDQSLWYANPNLLLRWSNVVGALGFSYVLNEKPIFNPDNTVNSSENSVAYNNLLSNTYYFHIKALGEGQVWGGTTHFAVNVDTRPPAAFPIDVRPGAKTTSKTVFLHFATTDKHSGLDRYEYSVIPLTPSIAKSAEAYQTFFIETTPPEIVDLEKGKYDVIVRAYDKSGNFEESVRRVRIVSPLVLFLTSKWTISTIIILIIILGFISPKALRWYRKLEERHGRELPNKVKSQIEELKNYRKKYGKISVIFGLIFTGFLFGFQSVSAQEAINITPPFISTISKNISNEDIFYVGGKTDNNNIDVIIYLQNLRTGETHSFITQSDNKGDWFYRHPSFLSTGEYLIWTQSSLGELMSPPSPQAKINVTRTAIQFGSNRISFETLYLVLVIVLLLALFALSFWLSVIFRKGKKKHLALMREVKEAEEAVRRGFAVLKRDIEAELSVIHKAKLNKSLSSEEKQKEDQLLRDLAEMERYIGKEVWDIEKYT